jgi:hypothetical protein
MKGHEADRAFLAKLRAATPEQLEELRLNHCGKTAPRWKRIAIQRAIARARR